MGGVWKCEWPNAPANAGIQPRRTSSVTECANSLYPAWINECRSMLHVHPGARLASFVHIGWRRRSKLDSTHWCDVFDNRQLVVCLCWSDSVNSWWSKMNAVNALQWNCCHFSRVFAKHLEMAHWSENYWGKSYKLCLDLDGSDNEDLRPGNVLSYLQLGRQSAGPQCIERAMVSVWIFGQDELLESVGWRLRIYITGITAIDPIYVLSASDQIITTTCLEGRC